MNSSESPIHWKSHASLNSLPLDSRGRCNLPLFRKKWLEWLQINLHKFSDKISASILNDWCDTAVGLKLKNNWLWWMLKDWTLILAFMIHRLLFVAFFRWQISSLAVRFFYSNAVLQTCKQISPNDLWFYYLQQMLIAYQLIFGEVYLISFF